MLVVSLQILSSHVLSSKPCPRPGPALLGVPWGSGMLWDEMNEAQSKEPLTQQEGAGEGEVTEKIYIPKLSWLSSDYFTLFTNI